MSLLPFYNENELEVCLDEAGLNCIAGPIYAAAVVWPHPDIFEQKHRTYLEMLNDVEKLTQTQYIQLKEFIEDFAIDYFVAIVDVDEINKINIYNARFKAMHTATRSLSVIPDYLLVNGTKFAEYIDPNTENSIPYICIMKGHEKYQGIAAAHILAQVERDQYMNTLHSMYPMYGWNKNKGYGTKSHYKSIKEYGPVPPHRMNYNLRLTNGDEDTLPDVILIHIPKTAGTTLYRILQKEEVIFKELHFNSNLRCAPCKYLDKILADPNQKVILTWRDPVEHLWSTFHFYQEYKHFHYPTNIEAFIEHPSLQNQQSAFLLKEHFFDSHDFTEIECKKIRALIDRPSTMCFVQNYFQASLEKLNRFLNLSISTVDDICRFNFNKPPSIQLNDKILDKFRDLNKIDIEIYNHILDKYYPNDKHTPSSSLPSNIPIEYPMNLVAGKVSLKQYQPILEKIHFKLKQLKLSTIHEYMDHWLDIFSALINYKTKNLKDLETFLNDSSEKIHIKTIVN